MPFAFGLRATQRAARCRKPGFIFALAATLAFALTGAVAHAGVLSDNWTGNTSTDFTDVTNWDNGLPDTSNFTVIDLGTGNLVVLSTNYTIGTLIVGNTTTGAANSLTIQDGAVFASGFATLGKNSNSGGSATVTGSGSTWNVGSNLVIGSTGNGNLTISNGGSVTSSEGDLGDLAGSNGNVTVSDAGSTWDLGASNLIVGLNGNGTLTVANGGNVTSGQAFIGYNSGTTDSATVRDSDSIWTLSNILYVGLNGNGSLTIANGGNVSGTQASLGSNLGANGNATVSDVDSTLLLTSILTVGDSSNGSLTVANGGLVDVQGSDGNGVGVYIGNANTSNGTVSVQDTVSGTPSTLQADSGAIAVGFNGTGNLQVSNGGLVQAAGADGNGFALVLGYNANSTGTANVSGVQGAPSEILVNGGALVVGYNGNGTLDISSGGLVNATATDGTAGIYVGQASGSNGTVSVDGASGSNISTLRNTNTAFIIGNDGTGNLSVTNGGQVLSLGTDSSHYSAYIAAQSDGTGSATVSDNTDNQSTWLLARALAVGYNGNGTLTVANGGSVIAGNTGSNFNGLGLTVGDQAGSNGTVTITDENSAQSEIYVKNGGAAVGYLGNGNLTVANGGNFSINGTDSSGVALYLGYDVNATGNLSIHDGDSAMFLNSGALVVGYNGTATLAIANQAYADLFAADSGNVAVYVGDNTGSNGTITLNATNLNLLSTSGSIIVGEGGNGTVTIQNGGAIYQQKADDQGNAMVIGDQAGSNGSVTVTGSGSLLSANTGSFIVGNAGNATLDVENGGQVSTAFSTIASQDGSVGNVTVNGTGSSWGMGGNNLVIGDAGNATVTITNGGDVSMQDAVLGNSTNGSGNLSLASGGTYEGNTISIGVNGMGTVTVSDTNSNLSVGGGGISYVGDAGNGSLTVANGGTFVSNGSLTVANQDGSTGNMVVTDASSNLTVANQLIVGNSGNGNFSIINGGSFTANSLEIGENANGTGTVLVSDANSTLTLLTDDGVIVGNGGNGSLTVQNGGNVNTLFLDVGNEFGGYGTVLVTDANSTIAVNGDSYVGYDGAANLTVQNGGTFNTTGNIYLGYGSAGNVTVTGANSTLIVGNTFAVGFDAGNGTLLVSNGGFVNAGTVSIGANSDDGTNGFATVTDANSTLYVSGGSLTVGDAGNGTLTVQNGGNVTAGDVYLGNQTTGVGTMTVTGANSTLSANDIYLGNNGAGNLSIVNGAVVTAIYLDVGSQSGSNGTLLVSDANTTLNITGGDGLIIGDSGNGSLTVQNGGNVTTRFFDVGNEPDTATALLTDANSTITVNGDSYVGYDGEANLTVQNGGNLTTTGNFYIADGSDGNVTVTDANSTLTVSGGLFVGDDSSYNGTLTVQNGGNVTTGGLFVGYDDGSNGTVLVTGNGSLLTTTSGESDVGNNSNGTLNITNGAEVDLQGVNNSRNVSLYVARNDGSFGNVTVDGNGTVLNADNGGIRVGNRGTGYLTVSNGGIVNIYGADIYSSSLNLGQETDGVGNVLITDTGSTIYTNTDAVWVGNQGTGNLTIQNGGFANFTGTDGSEGLYLGVGESGNGSVLVTDTGSKLAVTNGATDVGFNGNGTLTVQNGAVVDLAGVYAPEDVGLFIARHNDSSGSITVDNSTLTVDNAGVRVGNRGTGSLTIQNGGNVTITGVDYDSVSLDLGHTDNGNGTVTVTDPGSQLIVNGGGTTMVGDGGSAGSLTVANGASATFNGDDGSGYSLVVGEYASGNFLLTDANSTISLGGNVLVGDSGNGTLTVANGAVLDLSGVDVRLANTIDGAGTLGIASGGKLIVGNVTNGGGLAYVDFNGGTLQFTQDLLLDSFNGTFEDGTFSTLDTNTYNITWSETSFSGNGDLNISGNGAFAYSNFSGGSLGNLTIGNATVYFDNSGLGVNGTAVLGSGNNSVAALNLINGSELDIYGNDINGYSLRVSDDINSTGSVYIDNGGFLYVYAGVALGVANAGTFTVNNGGEVELNVNNASATALSLDNNSTLTIADDQGNNTTFTVDNGAIVAANGSINITGGTVSIKNGSLRVASTGNATITQSGGNVTFTNSTADTRLGVASGVVGTYNMTGGNLTVDSNFQLGANVDWLESGDGATGIFNQSGGNVTVSGYTSLGRYGSDSVGVYNITGGNYTQQGENFIVGESGNGTLDVSGGVFSTGYTSLWISHTGDGSFPDGNGTVNLTGGVLATAGIFRWPSNGSALLNLDGGTLQATDNNSDFISDFSLGEIVLGDNGVTFDSGLYNITVNDSFSGNGTVTKIGSGNLTLDGTFTFGGVIVNGGYLNVNNTVTVNGDTDVASGWCVTGALAVLDSLYTTANLTIAGGHYSNGSVLVSSTGAIDASYVSVGERGTGSLTVNGESEVDITGADSYGVGLKLGQRGSGNGTVIVTDSGSELDVTNGTVLVGYNGTGNLTVANGALLVASGSDESNVAVYVGGRNSGQGNGSVTVTDADSQLAVTGGSLVIDGGGNGSVTVANGGNLTVSGTDNNGVGLLMGQSLTESSNLTITNAGSFATITNGSVRVGDGGTANVTIANGGALNINGTSITGEDEIANSLTIGGYGNGSVLVTDSGSQLILDNDGDNVGGAIVGDYGNGNLTVANGGNVTLNAYDNNANSLVIANNGGSTGSVLVTDTGSSLSIINQQYTLVVGASGNGSLTIANGGSVFNDGWDDFGLIIGLNSDGTGTMNVTDLGSSYFSDQGTIVVGDHGAGSLNVLGGGNVILEAQAAFTDENNNVFGVIAGLSNDEGGTGNGSILVSDVNNTGNVYTPSFIYDSNTSAIGYNGTGSLTIANGGFYEAAGSDTNSVGMYIGYNAGSNGNVTVTDIEATSGFASTLQLDNGILVVGYNGTGCFTLTNGGQLVYNNTQADGNGEAIYAGYNSGSSGTIRVIGVDANDHPTTLTINSGGLVIGSNGDGQLTVAAGAYANISSTDGNGIGLYAGLNSGSSGHIIVTGIDDTSGNSSLLKISSSPLLIGQDGYGYLGVFNGGNVDAAGIDGSHVSAYLGFYSDGTGNARVSGVNNDNAPVSSTWNLYRALVIGASGNSILNVSNGGLINVGTHGSDVNGVGVYLGQNSGSYGCLTVADLEDYSGAQSTFNVLNGSLVVGNDGNGTLTVANAGYVHVTDHDGAGMGLIIGAQFDGTGTVTVQDVNNDNNSTSSTLALDNSALQVGGYGNGTLNIYNGGYVTVGTDGIGAYIGANAGSTGTVTVSDVESDSESQSTLTVHNGALSVGHYGNGTLNVYNGGYVNLGGINNDGSNIALYVGYDANATGCITVSGVELDSEDQSELNVANGGMVVGFNGTGTLSIANGGYLRQYGADNNTIALSIGYNAGSTGTVNVDGVEPNSEDVSTLSLTIGNLVVGYNGNGTLNITNGGLVELDSVTTYGTIIGDASTAIGTVTVDGTDGNTNYSTLSTGPIAVGYDGNGTLAVSNGGLVQVSGSNDNGEAVEIGLDANSTGQLTVDGAYSNVSINDGALVVGDYGNGTLNITNGGTVAVYGTDDNHNFGAYIGWHGGETGSVSVDGENSQLLVEYGPVVVGNWGNGTLTVTNLGYVDIGSEDGGDIGLFIGRGRNGNGNVTVDGNALVQEGNFTVPEHSSLSVDTGAISVGHDGQGSLTVSNGAEVFANGSDGDSVGLYLGYDSSGNGTVLVTDANSSLIIANAAVVGNDGTANLTIANGAHVVADGVTLGNNNGSAGYVTVTDAGSLLKSTDDVYVGDDGFGNLTVVNGGTVTLCGGTLWIGYESDGPGNVLVAGAGSALNVSNDVYVGDDGAATLTVASGGSASINGSLYIADSSDGNLTVTDTNSTLMVNGTTYVGEDGLQNASLTIANGAVANLTGADSNGVSLYVGTSDDSSGAVLVTDANSTLSVANGGVIVGDYTSGNLAVVNGGYVSIDGASNNDTGLSVGRESDSNGKVLVSDDGSELDVTAGSTRVGDYGEGRLIVLNGGEVDLSGADSNSITLDIGRHDSSDGKVVVVDSTLNITNGATNVGDRGEGKLVVVDDGYASLDGSDENSIGLNVGVHGSGNGSVVVAGDGTELDVTGGATYVGDHGQGSVGVYNAGYLYLYGTDANGVGLLISAHGSSSGSVVISGVNTDTYDQSELRVSSGSTVVGGWGNGTLTVSNAGYVKINSSDANGNSLIIGNHFTSNSSVLITDVEPNTYYQSELEANGATVVGNYGNGNLTVANGAYVGLAEDFSGNYGLVIGNQANSTSSVLVTDVEQNSYDGSELDIDGGGVMVGASGNGTLTVANGAVVYLYHTDENGLALVLGGSVGSSGNVSITGVETNSEDASYLQTQRGGIAVGYNGNGTLTVANGGYLDLHSSDNNDYSLAIGYNSGSNGTVTVTDVEPVTESASQLFARDQIAVGVDGNGTLTVTNGAVVEANGGLILGVNATATGALTISNNGVLEVGGEDGLVAGSGNYTAAIDGGKVQVIGDDLTSNLNISLGNDYGDNVIDTNNYNATFSGVLNGSGALDKNGAGTLYLAANETFTGGLNVYGGTLVVDGGFGGNLGNWCQTIGDLYVGLGPVENIADLNIVNGAKVYADEVSFGGNVIDNDHILVSDNGTLLHASESLTVGDAGEAHLTIANGAHVKADNATFGSQDGSSGYVTVTDAGSQLKIATDDLIVGNNGYGNLTVQNGGNVQVNGGTVNVGYTDGAGDILVTGAGSSLNTDGEVEVGIDSNATITIANGASADIGGQFDISQGGNATVTVTGANSTLMVNGTTHVGANNNAYANLTIANGASATLSNLTVGWGQDGNMLVTDANTTLTVNGVTYISQYLPGNFSVANGAVANLTGTDGANVSLYAGETNDSTGVITVDGVGSQLNTAGAVWVGSEGNGTLNVTNGGTVTVEGNDTSNHGIVIGGYSVGITNASVSIDGVGSLLDIQDGTSVLSYEAATNVSITNGGEFRAEGVDASGVGLYVGQGGAANLTVDGLDSVMNVTNGATIIGYNGTGTVNLTNGGSLISGNQGIGIATAYVGYFTNGTINISGISNEECIVLIQPGWEIENGALVVGYQANGTVNVTNGGAVEITNADNGNVSLYTGLAGGTGNILVDGAYSTFTIDEGAGVAFIGDSTDASLTVSNGGAFNAYGLDTTNHSLVIGANSNATVLVTDAGSALNASGSIVVGQSSGNTSLTVANGASVTTGVDNNGIGLDAGRSGGNATITVTDTDSVFSVGGNTVLGTGGNVSVTLENGGALEATSAINGTGATFTMDGGILRVINQDLTVGQDITLNNSYSLNNIFDTNNYNATQVGNLSGNGTLEKDGLGQLTVYGETTIGGDVVVQGGTLRISNAELTNNGSLLIASGDNDTAKLTLANGAVANTGIIDIGIGNNSQGELHVSGASQLTANYAVIGDNGDGNFTVKQGSSATLGTDESNVSAYLGNTTNGTGSILVTDTDSTLTTNGSIIVGLYGNGSVTVANGGNLTINGSDIANNGLVIGDLANGGVLVTDANSTLTVNSGAVDVGYQSTGSLDIENGGNVSTSSDVNMALVNTSTATLTVNGTGSTLAMPSNSLAVGVHGNGTLLVTNGGEVSAGYVGVGIWSDGTGNVTVDGANSMLLDSAGMDVGYHGTGNLTVSNGGYVSVASYVNVDVDGATGNGSVFILSNGTLATGSIASTGNLGTLTIDGGTLAATGNNSSFVASSLASFTLGGNGATIDSGNYNVGIYANMTGEGGLTKAGNGTVTLNVDNGFSGDTNIAAGTLILQSSGALQDSTLRYHSSGGNVDFGNLTNATLGGISGGHDLELSSTNGTVPVALSVGNDNQDTWFGGSITDSGLGGSLIKIGSGTLKLRGTSTFSGGTYIDNGTINFKSASNFGTGQIFIQGGTLQWGSNTTADISLTGLNLLEGFDTLDTNGNDVTLADNVTTTNATLVKAGDGNLTMNSTGTLAALAIAGGNLYLNGSFDLGGGNLYVGNSPEIDPVFAVQNGGSLTANNAFVGYLGADGTMEVMDTNSTLTLNGSLYLGNICTNGTVDVANAGLLSVTGDVFVGAEDYSNGTLNVSDNGTLAINGTLYVGYSSTGNVSIVNGGTLSIGGEAGIQSGDGDYSFTLDGGVLQVSTSDLSTCIDITLGNCYEEPSIIDTNGLNATLNGEISGNGALQKNGDGTLYLTGNNDYAGGTFVTAGTLEVDGSIQHWSANVDVSSSGNTFCFPTSASLIVTNGGYIDADGLFIADNAFANDSVLITNGASISVSNNLTVGGAGNGSLTVSNGAELYVDDDPIFADQSGSQATVTITDSDSYLYIGNSLTVGNNGNASLTIANGAEARIYGSTDNGSGLVIGRYGNSTSSVLVTDGDTSLYVSDGATRVGDYGTGNLAVVNGGYTDMEGYDDRMVGLYVGRHDGSNGTVLVSDSGSELDVGNGVTRVGDYGTGNFTVANGASAYLTGNDNDYIALDVGRHSDGNGTVLVTDAGSYLQIGYLQEGDAGPGEAIVGDSGAGNLTVAAGGNATLVAYDNNETTLLVGANEGSNGAILVTDSNSTMYILGLAYGVTIGGSGNGTLSVVNGGTFYDSGWDDSGVALYVGANFGGSGNVTVDGFGSNLTLDSGALYVGDAGAGSVSITNGGTLTATNANDATAAVILGNQSSGNGTLTVDGDGTSLLVNGDAIIGVSGNGTLNVGDDSQANISGNLLLAENANATASLNVYNAGTLQFAGNITAGDGNYTATVDGGSLQSQAEGLTVGINLTLGNDYGNNVFDTNGYDFTVSGVLSGNGVLEKDGSGVLTLTANNSYAGGTDVTAGTLTVDGGAIYHPEGDLYVGGESANLSIVNGGSVDAGEVTFASFDYSYDTVTVDGANSTLTAEESLTVGDIGNATLNVTNGAAVTVVQSSADIGLYGNGTLNVTNGSSVDLQGSNDPETVGLYVGHKDGSNGTVLVSDAGSVLTVDNGGVRVGNRGTGNLTVANGGNVTIGGQDYYGFALDIAHQSEASGTVLVTDANSSLQIANGELIVGNLGNGNLTVTNTASLTVLNGNSDGETDIGYYGTGSLMVSAGGNVDLQGVYSPETVGLFVGRYDGSNGTVLVTDAGSVLTVDNAGVRVGNRGTGNLTVANGGNVTIGGEDYYGYGLDIGHQSEANGTVLVTDANSTLTVENGSVAVGNLGTATLIIANGGVANQLGADGYNIAAYIGASEGSNGNATVDGAGSQWLLNGALFVGYDGNGSLTVSNGGNVTVESAETYGDNPGLVTIGDASGNVSIAVTGANSTLNVQQGPVVLAGGNANTTVAVTNGGKFVVGGNDTSGIGLDIGQRGQVNVTVDGANSTINVVNGSTIVGDSAAGNLTVSNGAVFSGNGADENGLNLIVGNNEDADGLVDITDGGSQYDAYAGAILVGHEGNGTLNVYNGGTLVSNGTDGNGIAMYVGNQNGAQGTLNIDGTGSQVHLNNGTLVVGTYGTGTVNVANGGELDASSGLSLAAGTGSSGTVNLNNGGTIDVAGDNGITTGLGSSAFNLNGGTLRTTADFSTGANFNVNSGTSSINTNGNNATLNGNLTGNGDLAKDGNGTLTLTGNNAYGNTTINTGNLVVNGALTSANVTLAGASAVLGGNGTVNGDVLVNNGGVSPGIANPVSNNVASLSTLTVNGNLALNITTGTVVWHLASGNITPAADLLNVLGNLTSTQANATITFDFQSTGLFATDSVTNDVFTLITANNDFSGEGLQFNAINVGVPNWQANNSYFLFANGGKSLEYVLVPEPATWGLILGGAMLLVGGLRRKRRRE